ncbi:tetratricopeptide repeat protein [Reichenbachiella sp.]|uniref:tetratricopeptide repeat protein n=1 Tax=Reichenbachiella sp. TaxID=2184521 RepID=UPI003BB17220
MISTWKGRIILIVTFLNFAGVYPVFAQDEAQQDSISWLIGQAQKKTYREPEAAAELAKQAYALAKSQNQLIAQGEALRIIGGTYYIRGDYDLALENFLEAHQIFDEEEDRPKLTRILSNLGLVYKSLEDYERSLDYYQMSLALTTPNDSLVLSKVYNNIGVVHKRQLNFDSAEYYFTQSLSLKEGLGDTKGVANTLTNLGNVAADRNDNTGAIRLFRRSLNLEIELDYDEGIAKNVNNIANAYLKLNKVDSAIYYALIGYEIGSKLKTKIQIKESSEILSVCYAAKKNFRRAFSYQQIFVQYKDSLSNEDQSRKIGRLESKLQLAKQQSEIEQLKLANQLQATNLRASRNQIIWISILCFTIVLAAVAIYIFRVRAYRIDQIAQRSQMEALQKRYMELLHGPSKLDLGIDLEIFNEQLVTPLTEREYEILKLSLTGMTNKEIADKIFVSLSTIKFHLGNVYHKLGVSNKKEALEYVVKTS